jgi:hypothetical protein
MTHFSIHLPTKAYLCAYVRTLYGTNQQHIHLDPSSDFGDLIISKLASQIHCDLKPGEMDSRLFRLNDSLHLKIPIHWIRKLPATDLTRHQIIRINRTLENMFEHDLCDIVSRAHDIMGIDRQVAIACFAENHGIQLEHHITFEALKKMEYRYRFNNARHTVRKKIVQGLSCKNAAA